MVSVHDEISLGKWVVLVLLISPSSCWNKELLDGVLSLVCLIEVEEEVGEVDRVSQFPLVQLGLDDMM